MGNPKVCLATVFFCLLLPITSVAIPLDLTLTSDTIIRLFNRSTAQSDDTDVVPIYEYLQAEYNSTAIPELHGHFYGWYRADAADKEYFKENTASELLYGYLEYASEVQNINLKLGRQGVYNAPSHESFDGLLVSGDLFEFLNLETYYGLPIGLDQGHSRGNDQIFGGRLALQPKRFDLPYCLTTTVNMGFSYLQIDRDGIEDKKLAGFDYYFDLPGTLPAFVGEANFNIITDDWSELFLETKFDVFHLNIRPYIQYVDLADYISSENVAEIDAPFSNYKQRGDNAREIGTDIIWQSESAYNYGSKIKYFDYSESDETSYYLSGIADFHVFESIMGWVEAGRMQGDQTKYRYYSGEFGLEWDLPFEFQSLVATSELTYLHYDQEIYEIDDSLYLAFGLSTTFLDDSLHVKLNISYSSDPYYIDDFQTFLTLSYHLAMYEDEDE